ncbi:MAG: hypothetical protein AAFY36_10655 [Bacteroidota bacterium]
MIRTKKHPVKYYAFLAFMAGFWTLLGLLLVFVAFGEPTPNDFGVADLIICLFGVCLLALAFVMVRSYARNVPVITLSEQRICFDDQCYDLADIHRVSLTGKVPFKFVINTQKEGGQISFKGGNKRYIYDDFYFNLWQVKLFLKKKIIEQEHDFALSDIEVDQPADGVIGQLEKFKGHVWASYRGILFFVVVVLMIGTLLDSKDVISWFGFFVLLVFLPLWFLLNTWLMHYFALNGKYLVIRNQLAFWRREVFEVSNIEEVVFESSSEAPNSMRVITKDFKHVKYFGATLSTKTWEKLVKRLSKTSIRVRNEADF